MSATTEFLTAFEEEEIVEAIRLAEELTSGEIRIHLEATTHGKAADARAAEVFHWLKMDNTALRNGVLIYLAVEDHQFVILGDEGINRLVETDFWDCTRDAMLAHFRKGAFKEGLITGVRLAGERLSKFFPWEHGDRNELSNEISKG